MPSSTPIKNSASPAIKSAPPINKRTSTPRPSGAAVSPSAMTIAITGKTDVSVSLNFAIIPIFDTGFYGLQQPDAAVPLRKALPALAFNAAYPVRRKFFCAVKVVVFVIAAFFFCYGRNRLIPCGNFT